MAWNGLAAGGYVCPVMDARRQQVYNALFRIENNRPVRITEDRPIALAELAEEVRALGESVLLVGDGAELTGKFFDANGIACRLAPENIRYQSAVGVALAAEDMARRGETVSGRDLVPTYLRLSQAERERLAKGLKITLE